MNACLFAFLFASTVATSLTACRSEEASVSGLNAAPSTGGTTLGGLRIRPEKEVTQIYEAADWTIFPKGYELPDVYERKMNAKKEEGSVTLGHSDTDWNSDLLSISRINYT
jgi:hypothetical protein